MLIESDDIIVSWMEAMPFDYSADDIVVLLNKARAWLKDFLERFNSCGAFEPVYEVKWYRTQDKLDANLFIFTIEMKAKEIQGQCFAQ
jgi:hypothetical protein